MKNLKYIATLLLLLFIFSCKKDKISESYIVNFLPCEDKENDGYGFLNSDGKFTIEQEFDYLPSIVVNDYFSVESDEGEILCHWKDNSFKKVSDEYYAAFGIMCDGLIPACKHYSHIEVLNESGNSEFVLDKVDGIEVAGCYSYSNGFLRVLLSDDNYVYVDRTGKNIFLKKFANATDFKGKYAVVQSLEDYENDRAALLNDNGDVVFSFNCDDFDGISFNSDERKLAAINEDRVIIYDYDGIILLRTPSKVESVYSLGNKSFIFKSSYDYGLMDYMGQQLIRPKYKQLVTNGKYLLAIHEDDDEITKLIDENDNVIETFDGDKIYDFRSRGYYFPNVLRTPDDELLVVNDKGVLTSKSPLILDYDFDDVEYANQVHSLFFPKEAVYEKVFNFCGKGLGLPESEGMFFIKDGRHCIPGDIKFIREDCDLSVLKGNKNASIDICQGENYVVSFVASFDEPIVNSYSDKLSTTAWLIAAQINVYIRNFFYCVPFYNQLVKDLEDSGCEILYSKNYQYIFKNRLNNILIVMVRSNNSDRFTIYIRDNNESNLSYWKNYINNM